MVIGNTQPYWHIICWDELALWRRLSKLQIGNVCELMPLIAENQLKVLVLSSFKINLKTYASHDRICFWQHFEALFSVSLSSCRLQILFIYHVSSTLQYYVFIKKAVRLKLICITMYNSHCGALYIEISAYRVGRFNVTFWSQHTNEVFINL